MDIAEEVKKLNLPLGKYVVVGSAILQMKGIRNSGDIDLVVSQDLFRDLQKKGWKRKWFFCGMFQRRAITNGTMEAFSNRNYKNYWGSAETLIGKAEIIDGIPFWPLDELVKFKKELGREKDLKDIMSINEYLKKLDNEIS